MLVAVHQDIASGKDDCQPGIQAALTRCRQLGGGAVHSRRRHAGCRRLDDAGLCDDGAERAGADFGADAGGACGGTGEGGSAGRGLGVSPAAGLDAAAAGLARREAAEHGAHRLALQVERLMAAGVLSQAALVGALHVCRTPAPTSLGAWTHTADPGVMARANA